MPKEDDIEANENTPLLPGQYPIASSSISRVLPEAEEDEAEDIEAGKYTPPVPGEYPIASPPISQEPFLPIANPMVAESKKGFVIGNYVQNEKYAQQVLDEAAAQRLFWIRLKPQLKEAATGTVATAANVTLTSGLSQLVLDTTANDNPIVGMIKMNAIQAAVSGLTTSLKGAIEAIISPPKGEELAAATMKKAVARANKERLNMDSKEVA